MTALRTSSWRFKLKSKVMCNVQILLNNGKQEPLHLTIDNMVNGPPTPPPTTATELQDEAREHLPVAEASTSLPQNRTEHYDHVLTSIIEAISNKDYSQVISITQETDYEVFDVRPFIR